MKKETNQSEKGMWSRFKRITTTLIMIIVACIVYVQLAMEIERAGPKTSWPSGLPGYLVGYNWNGEVVVYGPKSRSGKTVPAAGVPNTGEWLGYSPFYQGVVIHDSLENNLSVLRFDRGMGRAEVHRSGDTRVYETNWWKLSADRIYRVFLRQKPAVVITRNLDAGRLRENSVELPLPYNVGSALEEYVSDSSVRADRIVFSIRDEVILGDLRHKTASRLSWGTSPVFLSDEQIAFVTFGGGLNRISVSVLNLRTKRTREIEVWKTKGFAWLLLPLPILPQRRPESAIRMFHIPGTNVLLVEVSQMEFASSYLFVVDVSNGRVSLMPSTVARRKWAWMPADVERRPGIRQQPAEH